MALCETATVQEEEQQQQHDGGTRWPGMNGTHFFL